MQNINLSENMERIYFKGLEKSLNDGCYIKVFSCSMRYPVVRVEKKDIETGKEKLISYSENGNVLSALNTASNKIIDETANITDDRIWYDNTLIDKVIEQGYTLHFYKLSNNQVLATICGGGYGHYIPVKSIIADDIQTSFETLNASLLPFNFDTPYDFYDFVKSQTSPVEEYQKKLTQNNLKLK